MGRFNFYAIHRPIQGVFTSWDEAKPHILGVRGAVHKGFNSREEALYFSQTGKAPDPRPSSLSYQTATEQMELLPDPAKPTGPRIFVWTDGSARPNPGAGGWAAILQYSVRGEDKPRELVIDGHEAETTNNRMELMAVIEALWAIKRPSHVVVHTDSGYVKKMAEGARAQANHDLVQRLRTAIRRHHHVEIKWVRGHAGHPLNERVDRIAATAREWRDVEMVG